jgi:hypothetical protein
LPGAIPDQELVFEEKRLRNDGTDAARTEQPSQDGNEMDEKNGQIAHRRMVAGRGILRNLGRNNNSPATGARKKRRSTALISSPRKLMDSRFILSISARRVPAQYRCC